MFPGAAMGSRFAEPGELGAGCWRDVAFHLPRLAALSPQLGTHCHASARVWLGPVVSVPSCWFYLVMKCFLEKEGAAEAKRALPGAGVVQQPEGKSLALAGRGSELSNASPSSKALPRGSGKEQAGERRGVVPVTFPFVQALQERLELLLVEDRALCVPLAQHHPGLLQTGNLKVDRADGGCWGQHSPWAPSSGLARWSHGDTAWSWSHGRSPAHSSVWCSPKQPPPPALMAKDGTSLTPRLGSGFLPPPCVPGQQLPRVAVSLKMRHREGAAVQPPLCRQEARLPIWARFKIEF